MSDDRYEVLRRLAVEADRELLQPSIEGGAWQVLCRGLLGSALDALYDPSDLTLVVEVGIVAREVHRYAVASDAP